MTEFSRHEFRHGGLSLPMYHDGNSLKGNSVIMGQTDYMTETLFGMG